MSRRRGAVLILVIFGILVIAAGIGLDHTGRLVSLVSRQRETLQRLRAADIPGRTIRPTACRRGPFPVPTPARPNGD